METDFSKLKGGGKVLLRLVDTIQTVFGAPINQKAFRIWKGKQFPPLCLLYILVQTNTCSQTYTSFWYFLVVWYDDLLNCFIPSESFQAATRELQRIYGKEQLNL